MSSYVNKKIRAFREAGDLEVHRKRSEGRMKSYFSATDARSWCPSKEDRRQHILDLIRQGDGRGVSLGKYIPIEAIIDILLADKNADIERLQKENDALRKKLKELEGHGKQDQKKTAVEEHKDQTTKPKEPKEMVTTEEREIVVAKDREKEREEEPRGMGRSAAGMGRSGAGMGRSAAGMGRAGEEEEEKEKEKRDEKEKVEELMRTGKDSDQSKDEPVEPTHTGEDLEAGQKTEEKPKLELFSARSKPDEQAETQKEESVADGIDEAKPGPSKETVDADKKPMEESQRDDDEHQKAAALLKGKSPEDQMLALKNALQEAEEFYALQSALAVAAIERLENVKDIVDDKDSPSNKGGRTPDETLKLASDVLKLTNNLNAQKRDLRAIERKIDEMEGSGPVPEEIEKQRKELEGNIQRLEKQLADYDKEKLDGLKEDEDNLKKRFDKTRELEDEIRKLKKQKGTVAEPAGDTREKDQLLAKIAALEKELQCARNALKECEILKVEKNCIKMRLDDLSKVQKDYEDLLKKTQGFEAMKAECAMYKAKYEELKNMEAQCNEFKAKAQRVDQLEEERRLLMKEIDDCECCMTNQEDEIKRLACHIDCLTQDLDKRQDEMKLNVLTMKTDIDKKDSLIAKSEQQLEEVQDQLRSSIESLSCETTCLRNRIDELEEEVEEYQTALTDLETKSAEQYKLLQDRCNSAEESNKILLEKLENEKTGKQKLEMSLKSAIRSDDHLKRMLCQAKCAISCITQKIEKHDIIQVGRLEAERDNYLKKIQELELGIGDHKTPGDCEAELMKANDTIKSLSDMLEQLKGIAEENEVLRKTAAELQEAAKQEIHKQSKENLDQCQEFRDKLSQKDKIIEDLRKQIADLQNILESAKEGESDAAEMARLKGEITVLQAEIDRLQFELQRQRKESEDALAKMRSKADQLALDAEKLKRVEAENVELQLEIERLKMENSLLKQELEKIRKQPVTGAVTGADAPLENENKNLKDEINKLKQQLAAKTEELEKQNKELNDLKEQVNNLQNENKNLRDQINILKQQQGSNVDLGVPQSEVDRLTKDLNDKLNKMQQENQDLKDELNKLKQQNKELNDEKNKLQQQNKELNDEKNKLGQQNKELNDQKNKLQHQNEELNDEKNQLQQQNKDLKNEQNKLKQDLANKEDSHKGEDFTKERDELLKQIAAQKKDIGELLDKIKQPTATDDTTTLKELEKRNKENEQLRNSIEALEKQLKDLQKAQLDVPKPSPEIDTVINELRKNLEQEERKVRDLEDALKKCQDGSDKLKQQVGQLQGDNDALKQQLADKGQTPVVDTDAAKRIKELEAALAKNKQECTDNIASLKEQYDRDIKKLQQQNRDSIDKLQKAHQNELDLLNRQCDNQLSTLKEQLRKKEAENPVQDQPNKIETPEEKQPLATIEEEKVVTKTGGVCICGKLPAIIPLAPAVPDDRSGSSRAPDQTLSSRAQQFGMPTPLMATTMAPSMALARAPQEQVASIKKIVELENKLLLKQQHTKQKIELLQDTVDKFRRELELEKQRNNDLVNRYTNQKKTVANMQMEMEMVRRENVCDKKKLRELNTTLQHIIQRGPGTRQPTIPHFHTELTVVGCDNKFETAMRAWQPHCQCPGGERSTDSFEIDE